jgi:2-oxoglutarate ferredoxin oxidoreductase subunit delta
MTGKILIDIERCKGCGLCVTVCSKNGIVVSDQSNQKGYFPAQAKNTDCNACAHCAIICPEAGIRVILEGDIVAIEPGRKTKAGPVKEKV